MNRLLAFIGFLVVAAGVYFAFIYEPCKEPTDTVVGSAYLRCALTADREVLRKNVCKKLGRQSECEITFDDEAVVLEALDEYMTDCAKGVLKEGNYCTDKMKSLKDL
jgi:hypothetical protein